MNNKGFTLIEVLLTLVVISLVLGITINYFNSTTAINKEEAYKIMKNNIVSVSYDYVNECNAGLIECSISLNEIQDSTNQNELETNNDDTKEVTNDKKENNKKKTEKQQNDSNNDNNIIQDNTTTSVNNKFIANELKTSGYLTNLESPIDGKDLGDCLIIEVTMVDGVIDINLIDNCYL